jgi:ribosomal protein S18 acetylase RimI-like enzyme
LDHVQKAFILNWHEMPTELKRISSADIPVVIDLLNRSSAGYSFAFRLNLVSYLNLSRFWSFSYDLSYLAKAESQPAGVLLNSVDERSRDAYSFFWGVLPEFRMRRLSMELARTFLGQLKEQGFRRAYAVASVDSPLNIYRKLGYREECRMVELRATGIPARNGVNGAEPLPLDELMQALEPQALQPSTPWVTRPSFLMGAAPFLEFMHVQHNGELAAWMALTRWTGETSIVAFDFPQHREDAAHQLLAYLAAHPAKYPTPLSATHIVHGSRTDLLLRSAGFVPGSERVSLVLDLAAYPASRKR